MSLIVLVSGWAMSAEVFTEASVLLESQGYRVRCLSLDEAEGVCWPSLLACLNSVVTEPALLAGWSLGGDLCMRFAACYPDRVKAVITLGSTPCFVRRPDWRSGQAPAAFRAFSTGLARRGPAAASRFVAVCASGSLDPAARRLQLAAAAQDVHHGATDWEKLLGRLGEDSRAEWQKLACPACHCLGTADALVSSDTAAELAQLVPGQRVWVRPGGHALFLDYPQLLTEAVSALDDAGGHAR